MLDPNVQWWLRRAGSFLAGRWSAIAEGVRASTGVAPPVDRRTAETGTPWFGLLLWAVACSGLFLSLVVRPPAPEASGEAHELAEAVEASGSIDLTPSLPSTSLVATIDHAPIEEGAKR